MCGVDISQYRARIGNFYDKALKGSQRFLQCFNISNLYSFMFIMFYGKDGLPPALLLFILTFPLKGRTSMFDITSDYCNEQPIRTHKLDDHCINDNCITSMYILIVLLFCFSIILLCGDVHPNPGPSQSQMLSRIKIVHNNVSSLQNKACIIEAELNNFDIITVSETWLYKNFPSDKIRLDGYYPPVRKDREDGRAWGGVAIYVKNDLICKPRPDLDVPHLEAVWIETKLDQETFLVGSFYRPPNALAGYWDLIDESIKLAMSTPHKLVILGDFNADCKDNTHPHVQRILNYNSLHQLVNEPTHHLPDSTTLIDLILTPNPNLIDKVGVLAPVCSKHSCPYVEIINPVPKVTKLKRTVYNYSLLNEEKYLEELRAVDWQTIADCETLDIATDFFTNNLIEIARRCMPSKRITDRSNDKPWITDEIKKLILKKECVHRLAKTIDTPWCWNLFKRYRNDLTDKIRNRKEEYLKEIENSINSDVSFGSKCWWKLVNQFTIKKGVSTPDIPPIQYNNKVYYLSEEKAEAFNEHFTSNSTITGNDDEMPVLDVEENSIPELIISKEMVIDVIKNLNPNKAVGPDFVHNKMLIKAVDVIAGPLVVLFNRSLSEQKFPMSWKMANVTPIFKKGERELCGNYRPVSLLSCVSKVFEKCVQIHVFRYLKLYNLLTPCQSGFIPGDSTILQLLVMYDDFCKAIDNKITTQSVFFDISKAFDRVWHRGLIYKLQCIGIRGSLLGWFTDYINERKQAVVIKGKISSYRSVSAGVPQGSVLGPLLFLIYINDIGKSIDSTVKLFADDTSMYLALEDAIERSRVLNLDLQKIVDWSKNWKVDFNPTKTELMTFSNKRQPQTLPLTFTNEILTDKVMHKHLGVILQNNCKWNNHIESIVAKTRLLVACLRSYKYKFSRKTLNTIYTSFILPHLDYADIVWDNCTDLLSDELESLHLDAIRTIIGAVRGTSHIKLYTESGFVTLKERRRRHKLVMYFKMVNGLVPNYIREHLPPLVASINPYHRRNPLERSVPAFKTTLYQNSFFVSTTYLWNELPDCYKSTDSISVFKRLLSNNDVLVPSYYYGNNRVSEIIHCKLRLEISDLKGDLVKRHLLDNPACQCGFECENAKHYFFDCPLFNEARTNTLHLIDNVDYNLESILFGVNNKSAQANAIMFEHVHNYITLSQRFADNTT